MITIYIFTIFKNSIFTGKLLVLKTSGDNPKIGRF